MMADERGKKLLANLKAAFARDPNIDEYDFLPVLEPAHNCNPLVLERHKLGLELWVSRVLFDYAYQHLIQWRRKRPLSRDIDTNELLNLTRAVLLFNPDNATAWNIRKELITSKALSVAEDLQFGALILTKHPKSPETFGHRKWLLLRRRKRHIERLMRENKTEPNSNWKNDVLPEEDSAPAVTLLDSASLQHSTSLKSSKSSDVSSLPVDFALDDQVRMEVDREMDICAQAGDRYSNNYNAWSHRIWVLQQFTDNHRQVLTAELQQTESWIQQHVSDHSGLHYRQYLLSLSEPSQLLDSELLLVTGLITAFPGHEALWCHRRYIITALMSRDNTSSVPPSKTQAAKKSRVVALRDVLLESELEFVCLVVKETRILDEWQTTLAERYRQWLNRMFTQK